MRRCLGLILLMTTAFLPGGHAHAQADTTCDDTLTSTSLYRGLMREQLGSIRGATNAIVTYLSAPDYANPFWQNRVRNALSGWQRPFVTSPESYPPAYAEFHDQWELMADALDTAAGAYLAYLDAPTSEHLSQAAESVDGALVAIRAFAPYGQMLDHCPP